MLRAPQPVPPDAIKVSAPTVEVDAQRLEAMARVRTEFEKIIPLSATTLVGIGPTQAAQHGGALRALGQILVEPNFASLRRRIFVVTAPDDSTLLHLTLQALGIVADNVPSFVVDKLKDQFPGAQMKAAYLATLVEQKVLRDAVALRAAAIELIAGATPAELELKDFLQQLLASLAGITLEQVPEHFNLEQLTEDVDLLIKA